MLCAIDDNSRNKLRAYLESNLRKMVKEDKPLDIDKYMTDLYRKLTETKPVEKSLSYIQLVPGLIRNMFRAYPELEDFFTDRGLSLDNLKALDKKFTTLESVSEYLGKQGIVDNILQQKALVGKIIHESGFDPVSDNSGDSKPYHAAPLSASTTTGQEALPGNIPDPTKAERYAFQKDLINQILSDPSKEAYITAMHASRVPGYKAVSPMDVVWVVTDRSGNILYTGGNQQVTRVISGGQTGGDIGGLRGARLAGIETGGTAPPGWVQYQKGNQKELLESFGLKEGEPDSTTYVKRTMKNVDDSDGTVAFLFGPSVGTEKTIGYAQTGKWQRGSNTSSDTGHKPVLVLTRDEPNKAAKVRDFVKRNNIKTLNIAGHRETSQPGIERIVETVIHKALSPEGEPMFYDFRDVIKDGNHYSTTSELAPPEAIVKDARNKGITISKAQAEETRQKQLKQSYDVTKYINENPSKNQITARITGGSLGYVKYAQSIETPMSQVNLGGPFSIEFQEDRTGHFFPGAAYFYTKGIDTPILLQRAEMPEELIYKIANTFTEPLFEAHGGKTYPIHAKTRLDLIKQYLNNTDRFMVTAEGEHLILHLNGSKVDLTDPMANDEIIEFFNTYSPTPGFDESGLPQEKKDSAIDGDKEGFESQLRQGSIVKKTDSTGKIFYEKYTKPAFNINKDYVKSPLHFNDYTLEPTKEGLLLKENKTDYIDWLKKHTYVNYELNKDGQILALNSYFNFGLTDESTKKLTPEAPKQEPIKETRPELPVSDAVKSWIDKVKKEGLKKSLEVAAEGIKATEDQIAEAKKWYENHPVSKHFPFEEAFNVFNSDRVAQWTMDGITLFRGSDYSDLYHEAFHGFSQGFLNPKQRRELYSEVRKRSGSFVDHRGDRILFSKATDLQVEEYLAEDFRKYMLNEKTQKDAPKRNTIFRRILDFLKALFGNTTHAQMLIDSRSVDVINKLYEKLRVGNINEYTFNQENASFDSLGSGIKAIDPKDDIQELTSDESLLALSTIDSLFSTFVDEYNKANQDKITNHIFSTERGRQIAYETVLTELKHKRNQLFLDNVKEENPLQRVTNQRNMATLDYMIKNFGDVEDPKATKSDKGLIAYHNKKSKFLSFADKFVEEETNLPEYAFKGGNETSVFEKGRPEVWYLIRGLHKRDKNGALVMNRLGFPELVDFNSTKNRLIKTLQDSKDRHEMFARLDKAKANYPFVGQLLDKLGDVNSVDHHTFEMWNSFFQTFNRYREPLQTVIFDKEGDKFIAKVGEAYGDHKVVQRQWDQLFAAGLTRSKYLIRKGNERPTLDIKSVLNDYPKVTKANLLQFLNDIGVPIDKDNEDIQKEIRDGAYDRVGLYLRERLVSLLKHEGPVNSLHVIFKENILNKFNEKKNESSRYDQIARLQVKYSDQYSNFSVSTATGDTRYEHSLNSSMTAVAKGINTAKDYSDLLIGSLRYLDQGVNPMAKVSKALKALFDKDGKRTDVIYIVDNLNGTSLTENNESTDVGTSSATADEFTKVIQDIHLLFFKGVVENPRHGEKSTSVSTRVSKYDTPYSRDKRFWLGPENFIPGDRSVDKKIYDSIIPYLNAEHERVWKMNNLQPGDPELDYPDYVKNGKKFVMFDDILSEDTKNELYKTAPGTITPKVQNMISKDFGTYWNDQFDRMILQFNKAPFISSNLVDNITAGKDNPLARYKGKYKDLSEIIVKAFTFNTWIHNVEAGILNYGDVAQYKTAIDFHKRIAMFSSTGDIFSTDPTTMRYLNQLGMGYAKSLGMSEKHFTPILKTAIMKDPIMDSAYYDQIKDGLKDGIRQDWNASGKKYTEAELEAEAEKQAGAYKDMKIGDAQGWVTFDSYRALSVANGKWSEKQEGLYQRIIAGENVSPLQAMEYFPVRKYQYAGPLKTLGLPIMAGHKFSLMPLIPTVVKGTSLETLHHKMIAEGVDYATLTSGSKISTTTNQGKTDSMYSDFKTRTLDMAPFTPNLIYMDFLKDQQDVNSEFKGQAIFSTQLRKVIEEGLVEGGVPTDFNLDKDLDTRRRMWNALSESQKIATSEKYRLYKEYESSVARLTEKKKQGLIKEIGWDKPDKYGKVTQQLIDLVEKELSRQDISDHELDYIKLKNFYTEALKYDDLSFHLTAEKIEKLLSSLINRRLVRQKISGEPLVQVSSLGFTNPSQKDVEAYGNDLPFYQRTKDGPTKAMKIKVALKAGKIVSGVYVPSAFEHLLKLTDNEGKAIGTRERLNELLKDEQWLNTKDHRRMVTLVGTRIPVQGLNSMEFMEVHEFLPAEAGNIIIPPAEIVAKSGSDFDIDKLTVMIPNIKEKNGEISLYKPYSREEAKELYRTMNLTIKDISETQSYEEWLRVKKTADLTGRIIARAAEAENRDTHTVNFNDLLDEELQILEDNGDIKPFEQFFKEINSNTKQEENEVIWNMRKILEHPDNYASLVRPNAIFTLGPIASDEFRSQVSEYDPKQGKSVVSGSRLMEYQYNLYVHQINKVAKEALAIAAVDNTFNIMFNRVGAYMNPFYMDKTAKAPKTAAIRKDITLHLPHNTLTNPEGKKVISLSHITDAEGRHRISDNVSQIINLLLEIAKNDSAYYLQLNREIIPTLLFLNQAGVPIDTLEYLVSQPIIREYMNQIRLARSPIAEPLGKAPDKRNFFQNKARGVMLAGLRPSEDEVIPNKYGFAMDLYMDNPRTMEGIKSVYKLGQDLARTNPDAFDRNRLRDNLSSKEFTAKDRAVLLHWFEIEDMAKSVRDIKININPDTKKSPSMFAAMTKLMKIRLMDPKEILPDLIVEGLSTDSPISSFSEIGAFMIDFLKPLFSLRANEMIGNYLLSKVMSPQAQEEIENTFGDVDKFSSRFFNDLVSYIFQNKLRDFNISKTSQYKNLNTIATLEPLDVEQIPYLKFGAFVKDGVMHYDLDRLVRDFTDKNYTNSNYEKRGLAPLRQNVFKTAKEFYNYVFEREYLRYNTKLSDVVTDPEFLSLRVKNLDIKADSEEARQKEIDRVTYEQYLRDRALENIGNGWKLFDSDDTYADQVIRTIQEFDLTDRYPLLNILSINQGRTSTKNLQLLDTDLTGDKVDAFHHILKELSDPGVYKVPDERENQRISKLFSKFPMVAFLQSGLNASGSFSLIRLVPAENFLSFMQGAASEFVSKLTPKKLDRFYGMFISANSNYSTRSRYKDYTAQDPSTGIRPVSKNVLEIFDTSRFFFTYEPGKLTEKDAIATVDNNPSMVFVYDKSVDKQGMNPGTTGLFSKSPTNRTVGLPTLTAYSDLPGKSITDKTLEANKKAIDEAIENLQALQDTGLDIVFNKNGYGQGLIGVKSDGATVMTKDKPGYETFLYLSRRLFEEFDYVNKNYDLLKGTPEENPREVLASGAPVSDSDVRDFIKKCLEL